MSVWWYPKRPLVPIAALDAQGVQTPASDRAVPSEFVVARGLLSRKKLRKRLETMDQAAWEAICQRCGLCCHERVVGPGGEIVAWGDPCPYLDTETNLCAQYEHRFELEVECKQVTPRIVQRKRCMPEGCAYYKLLDALEGEPS